MTPTQVALLATTGPAGFFVYNKIHYGSFCHFRNKKDKYNSYKESSDGSSIPSAPATSSSCCPKRRAKKLARKNSIELKNKTYEDFDATPAFEVKSNFDAKSDFDAKSTSSEIAPPAYRRN